MDPGLLKTLKDRKVNMEGSPHCPKCGSSDLGSDGICGDCGAVSDRVRCFDCGTWNPAAEKMCGHCGNELRLSFLPPV